MKEIEKAFMKTTELLFGKGFSSIDDHAEWLIRDLERTMVSVKSRVSGKELYIPDIKPFTMLKDNLVSMEESLVLGKKTISEKDLEGLSLATAARILKPISTTSVDIIYGQNIGSEQCACYGPTVYCYRSSMTWYSNYTALSFWPKWCEHVFGSSNLQRSKFCIKCYSSANLTRCFEVSDSNDCSDCYYSHNLDNCSDCLFCFNLKNKRYAIGNVELSREDYLRVKAMLLEWVNQELNKNRSVPLSIFNLGCFPKNS